MDVIALCIRLLINMLILLVAQVHNNYCAKNDDAAFPHIDPNRLQFFEYEVISVNCTTELTVKRKLKEINKTNISKWVTSAGSGTVKPAFSLDSGEYWCDDGERMRGNAVNISVTAGSVILESPVLPVKEGDNVTLRCKKKQSSDVIAEFYKDGLFIRTDYKGNLRIHNVSISDEGLYKCKISGAGESPESRLAVRVFSESHEGTPSKDNSTKETPTEETPTEETPTEVTKTTQTFQPWIVVSVLCAALLLLVLGVLYCCKYNGTQHKTEGSANRVSGEYSVVDSHHTTYAVVKKPRKEKEPRVFGARAEPYEPEESAVYSLVN